MTPLFLSFSLLLIYSQFASPANAFILQELPLYRNVRNQRHATPSIGPSKPSIDYGIRRSSVSMPLVIRLEDGMPTIFVRPSRAFNFHRLNRLQDFWHRNEALRRLTQTENRP
ncbi:hypothetical protein niasHT_015423 [Heterodera trifolii]|uniref:Uncharacterized protein n=1 Tax=Heterodera trifolii TaxID=157864 RepID=A0ABD2L009_9BILA